MLFTKNRTLLGYFHWHKRFYKRFKKGKLLNARLCKRLIEMKRMFWFGTRAGEMCFSGPLEISISPLVKKTFSYGDIINPLMTKPVRSRWLGIDFFRLHKIAGNIHPSLPSKLGHKGITRWLLPVRIEGEYPTTNFRPTAISSTFFSRKQVKWLIKTPDTKQEADKRAVL